MDYVMQQQELLSGLYQVMHNAAEDGYDSARFEIELEDNSTDEYFEYYLGDRRINATIPDPEGAKILPLTLNLHRVMKEHTGGSWTKMILTLDANGRADTQFIYPED